MIHIMYDRMGGMDKLRQIIINRMKAAREHAGYTQEELARLMGMQRAAYTQIETGSNMLTVQNLYKLCEALNRTPAYFLGLEDETKVRPDEVDLLAYYRNIPEGAARRVILKLVKDWSRENQNLSPHASENSQNEH